MTSLGGLLAAVPSCPICEVTGEVVKAHPEGAEKFAQRHKRSSEGGDLCIGALVLKRLARQTPERRDLQEALAKALSSGGGVSMTPAVAGIVGGAARMRGAIRAEVPDIEGRCEGLLGVMEDVEQLAVGLSGEGGGVVPAAHMTNYRQAATELTKLFEARRGEMREKTAAERVVEQMREAGRGVVFE